MSAVRRAESAALLVEDKELLLLFCAWRDIFENFRVEGGTLVLDVASWAEVRLDMRNVARSLSLHPETVRVDLRRLAMTGVIRPDGTVDEDVVQLIRARLLPQAVRRAAK